MAVLRIFSYLPNPRIWKATIAARLVGVEVEVRGAKSAELAQWLWDFEARPLSEAERVERGDLARVGRVGFRGTSILKTEAFLDAHPFGTVPAAFGPDGDVGIFESNSIMRAVARLGGPQSTLYGRDPYEASRIDSFLDAGLVFARDGQHYLLALRGQAVSAETHARARDAFQIYLAGIERALAPAREAIVGDTLTLADICFATELALFANERIQQDVLAREGLAQAWDGAVEAAHPRAFAHFSRLRRHPAFAPDMAAYLDKLEQRSAPAPA
ncbi:glutathione S-transferase family protein [Chelatococcus reniformis]|nr:glutathione S-transferase family protein [Chelatococcus reniformis]